MPHPGQCLNDMVPPHYKQLFDAVAAANDNAVMLPFPIWREAFNDADFALAQSAYDRLNPHPCKTFTEAISLKAPLAALPHSMPWHPRLSERLGRFRLVECQGRHESGFTDPATIADALIRAGRD